MNATARDDVAHRDALDRIAALEADVSLLMALMSVATGRLADLEGSPGPIDDEAVTTIKGAAWLTGYSETAVRKRIKIGRIEARKIGGRVLVRTASLTARREPR
jgi:hypothetical protein